MIQPTEIALVILTLIAALLAWRLWHERRLRRTMQLALEQIEAKHQAELKKRKQDWSEQLTLQERERIHRDLHDDIGAKLLQLIYQAPTPQWADSLRTVLQDLRDVVTRSRGTPGTVGEVLLDIEREARQRLNASGHELDWQQADELPATELNQGQSLHLHRIVREALSNLVQHAKARRAKVRIGVRGSGLHIEISDDGVGLESAVASGGSGRAGMQARAKALEGDIAWTAASIGGTKVVLNFPLDAGERV